MASNLKSARQAIEAELAHARQGAAYYATRVEALETALQQLESVETGKAGAADGAPAQAPSRMRKAKGVHRGRRPHATATNGSGHRSSAAENKRGRKARTTGSAKRGGDMPTTGSEFWLNLVSDQPRSAVDIANAAIETLGITPDQKEQIQKLKQRVSPALAGLVSSQKIQDSGAGRERRFFRSESSHAA